ncbi:MAG: anhydro-N-acetylmuramic acid kinase [Nonlabens sp.]
MKHQHYNVIGIMSGTSLDGVDIVHAKLVSQPEWGFQIHATQCISYTQAWRARLAHAVSMDLEEIEQLDRDYTRLLAGIINDFKSRNPTSNILAICAHGHTVKHEPVKGITIQIGNRPELATLTRERVVCDFRIQDVQLGGQGAPLVPIGDHLLFASYDYCLNLGGFSNVSLLKNNSRIAYDICPVNVVLNTLATRLGKEYDEGGAFAKAGTINTPVVNQLNRLDYYTAPAPKSLGMEWVNHEVMPLIKQLDPVDAIATFTDHAARQISKALPANERVLATGGGVYNSYLMDRIAHYRGAVISLPSDSLINYKEALIFGLLGVLRLRNQNNCLATVTGASHDHSSGKIYLP